jgi:hypothetical protein
MITAIPAAENMETAYKEEGRYSKDPTKKIKAL